MYSCLRTNTRHPIIINKISAFAKLIDINHVPHKGYPLPDPLLGRPRLNWCECKYQHCSDVFAQPPGLKAHLASVGKMTHGLHKNHENVVERLKLTPEKIKTDNLTRCPSYICDKSATIFTPEKLCDHFKILGIPPFWQEHMVITGDDIPLLTEFPYKNIYISDECVICSDTKSNIILIPCYHKILCIDCINTVRISNCPMCRTKIDQYMPF